MPDYDAIEFLIRRAMKEFFGGRSVYLNACAVINNVVKANGIPLNTEEVKIDITERRLNEQR